MLALLHEEGQRPTVVPPVTFDFRGDRDRRQTLGASPVPVERMHGGQPILEADPAHAWESGVVLNPAAVLVDDIDELEALMETWALDEADRDVLRDARGACVMLYRAQGTAYERTAGALHARRV